MDNLKKHSFGQMVFCKECGREVSSVWAESYDLARTGNGVCDKCREGEKVESEEVRSKSSESKTKAKAKAKAATIAPVTTESKEEPTPVT